MSGLRIVSLQSIFQEVLVAVVRIRFSTKRVEDAAAFRREIRGSLQSAMAQARALGYASQSVELTVFAVVAFLDESVLNRQNPAFVDWARRPLQEELFGGHLAGETFFQNLRTYLVKQDGSPEVADVLEVHCLCLLMGYRGRYALGDSGELHAMLLSARERIRRIRGEACLGFPSVMEASALPTIGPDRWNRILLWTAGSLAFLVLLAYTSYAIALASGITHLDRLQASEGNVAFVARESV